MLHRLISCSLHFSHSQFSSFFFPPILKIDSRWMWKMVEQSFFLFILTPAHRSFVMMSEANGLGLKNYAVDAVMILIFDKRKLSSTCKVKAHMKAGKSFTWSERERKQKGWKRRPDVFCDLKNKISCQVSAGSKLIHFCFCYDARILFALVHSWMKFSGGNESCLRVCYGINYLHFA